MDNRASLRHNQGSVWRERLNRSLVYFFFFVLVIIALYPLLWVATNSLKTDIQLFDNSWQFPKEMHWENYAKAWKYGIAKYILNSLVVTVSAVLLNAFFSLMAAYGLSRFRFKGQSIFLYFILGGLMLAPEVSLIPLFRILTTLKIYNKEAAVIDGAGTFAVFWKVVVPLCRPILASAMLLDAMRVWNEFMFALTFVVDDDIKTVPLGLMTFSGALREQWTVVMAGLIISAIPMILLYLMTQRQFIRGLTAGGVKG